MKKMMSNMIENMPRANFAMLNVPPFPNTFQSPVFAPSIKIYRMDRSPPVMSSTLAQNDQPSVHWRRKFRMAYGVYFTTVIMTFA
jgi:hypothetical protein